MHRGTTAPLETRNPVLDKSIQPQFSDYHPIPSYRHNFILFLH